jgi:hypothetical protein
MAPSSLPKSIKKVMTGFGIMRLRISDDSGEGEGGFGEKVKEVVGEAVKLKWRRYDDMGEGKKVAHDDSNFFFPSFFFYFWK